MPDSAAWDRRAFLAAALAGGTGWLLAGCAQSGRLATDLPSPPWPGTSGSSYSPPVPAGTTSPAPSASQSPPVPPGVLPRRQWATAAPRTSRMRPMRPVRYITVHHTAGPVFVASGRRDTAARLDDIRRYHQDDRGWGDIGYHFAVDRAGRVWECRPLSYQGAHVRYYNESNLGVVALGNFDEQQPSPAQLDGLRRHVQGLMRTYRVPISRLRTHQEWAPTACPGRSLQQYMVMARATRNMG
jgi:hypothetical protein